MKKHASYILCSLFIFLLISCEKDQPQHARYYSTSGLSGMERFLLTKAKYFDEEELIKVEEILQTVPERKWNILQKTEFADPNTALILSLTLGYVGIDRFYIGDVGEGIIKIFTLGGVLGIWTVVDWFCIKDITREKNMKKLKHVLVHDVFAQ